jgi:hypothetical protein
MQQMRPERTGESNAETQLNRHCHYNDSGAAAWTSSSHSAVKPAPAQIDPLSMMAKAKNLPSQESLNAKMWPDNAIVRY